MKIYNWGIIGLGKIANKFAQDLQRLPNARLHAVASTSLERARIFGEKYKAAHCFGSYEAIMDCPDLDVVYIATPHTTHCENAMMCLKKNIPVLCEKPLGVNAKEVRQMIKTAKHHQTFLMEAIWSRFMPQIHKILALIEDDVIGNVHTIKADFGFNAPFDPQWRLYNLDFAGGSLLDIGIYPVFLALLVLGKPQHIQAAANIGPTGVDESCAMIFQYKHNKLALLHSTIESKTNTDAYIYGDKGTIHILSRFHGLSAGINILNDKGEIVEEIRYEWDSWGIMHEAAAVMQCLDEGKIEHHWLQHRFSLALISTLDSVRRRIGLVYPADAKIE